MYSAVSSLFSKDIALFKSYYYYHYYYYYYSKRSMASVLPSIPSHTTIFLPQYTAIPRYFYFNTQLYHDKFIFNTHDVGSFSFHFNTQLCRKVDGFTFHLHTLLYNDVDGFSFHFNTQLYHEVEGFSLYFSLQCQAIPRR